MRAAPATVITLLAFLLAAGCLNHISSSRYYVNDYVQQMANVPISDSALTQNCLEANCVCMVCKKGTEFFPWLTSYVGGYCYFDKDCKPEKFQSIGAGGYGKDLTLNYFRLGQGPSFADFGDANGYCNTRLGMAVQWLAGSKTMPYPLPSASRAVCLLDKGVMPVYVLYSDGENIDATQTLQIANVLGTGGQDVATGRLTIKPVGPVVVTTEMNYDVSQAEAVKAQIEAINTGCRNDRSTNPPKIYCQVALAPKLGDYDALNAVMVDDPAACNLKPTDPASCKPSAISKQVDLIAYGIDSRYLDFSGSCDPTSAWNAAVEFSEYALHREGGKPSIIPYVLFDAGGTDASGTCPWDESSLINGYSAFIATYSQVLPQAGVIGVAPYSFTSTASSLGNPLACTDCALGKNNERISSWYGGCQAYTEQSINTAQDTDISPQPGTFIRFPDQASGSCNENFNAAFQVNQMSFTDNDFLSPGQPEMEKATDTLVRCDACISEKLGDPPFKFGTASVPLTYCDSFPELDYFASQFSLDPSYVRAIAAGESNFKPCQAAKVCKANPGTTGCFDTDDSTNDECYSTGFNSMSDPAAQCPLANAPNSGTSQPSWRWCGLGLMQSLEPPIDYWPDSYQPAGKTGDPAHVAIYNDALRRGLDIRLDLAKACNPTSFNPFNAADSACVGTMKLAEKMRIAAEKVRKYHNDRGVNLLDWEAGTDKDQVFIAYIAANLYAGTWPSDGSDVNNWVGDYYISWSTTAAYCAQNPNGKGCVSGQLDNCYGYKGYTDFVDYVRNCESDANKDRGASRMAAYYYLRDKCPNSFCPSWKRLDKMRKWTTANGGTNKVPYGG